jgi:Uma2 family endonuclease
MAEPARPLNLPEHENKRRWPAQGKWTYEDYRRLPQDGRRYEILRGHLYVSPAPSTDHQRTVNGLSWQLSLFVRGRALGEVFTAPYDILLPRGIATPVQPDLIFFRKGNLPRSGTPNFQGVPDLVIEVLSPGTRQLDLRKLAAFQEAGVPEVWHADPQEQTIVVYGLSEDGTSYLVLSRGGIGESVTSRLLPGLRVEVSEIFPPEPE